MFDVTIITGLASLFGCLCMGLVCAAQVAELFAAARPVMPHPWERPATPRPAYAPYAPEMAPAC